MYEGPAQGILVQVANTLRGLVPFVNGYVSTLGGPDRASILLTISFEAKADWQNGILENSRYAKFHWSSQPFLSSSMGYLELISGHGTAKFRQTNALTAEVGIAKLTKWIQETKALQSRITEDTNPKKYIAKPYQGTWGVFCSTTTGTGQFGYAATYEKYPRVHGLSQVEAEKRAALWNKEEMPEQINLYMAQISKDAQPLHEGSVGGVIERARAVAAKLKTGKVDPVWCTKAAQIIETLCDSYDETLDDIAAV